MAENIEKVPIDARLLSDAIIELNISRRNVAIYPQNHPSVDRSLNRAFEFMQKLFELRPEITLAVAKDTLIIDDYYLEKKHPVYREFALHLSDFNIAYVTFLTGLTKEELYAFHRFISSKVDDATKELLEERFRDLELIHIRAGFVDYGAFIFEEGKTHTGIPREDLWERYVYGLLDGTLQPDGVAGEIREIPPEVLARLLNKVAGEEFRQESYDQVITSYIRRSSETAFSGKDIRRLLDFINGLKPELKKQFLSSTVRTVAKDMDAAYKALSGVSVDEIIELLSTINEQKMVIPEALKNLLDKLSHLPQGSMDHVVFGDSMLIDDIFLSPEIVNLLGAGNFKAFVDDSYQKEIQKLMDYKSGTGPIGLSDLEKEYSDDIVERDFNHTILEILPLPFLNEEEYRFFLNRVKEQIDQFVWTGQYGQILNILNVLTSNRERNIYPDATSEVIALLFSPEFMGNLIESFRIVGRRMRDEAWTLCERYGDSIIPPLIDALINEDSSVVRKFFVGVLQRFGDRIIPEAVKRLGDGRWFVKRNMLHLLGECSSEAVLPYIRPYCRHEKSKVSYEAIRCLLNAGDSYGVEAVRDGLLSESKERIDQAIGLAKAYKLREVVPELMQLIRKRAIVGADLSYKISIVRALGEIADPRALDVLRELVTEKSILFKGITEKLREEVYRTLKHYPAGSIRHFIEVGARSHNEYIREESLRLSRTVTG